MRSILLTIASLILSCLPAASQGRFVGDTSIIFQPSTPIVTRSADFQPFVRSWGGDLLLSNNGFGLGLFYRNDLTEDLAVTVNFLISDVKDDAEVESFDIYGQSTIYGKKNRLLMMPLTVGLQYRLFREEIADNFRPFISAAAGPTMIYVSPYARLTDNGDGSYTQSQVEFFSSLKYGQMHYTYGGYIGAGAYFGIDRSTTSGLNVRYYFVPFPRGIEVMQNTFVKRFGGLYISLQFGSYF